MAHTFEYNQFNVTALDGAANVTTDVTMVTSIRWVSRSGSSGDGVTVTDGDGFTLWETAASGTAPFVEAEYMVRKWKNGFRVTELDSGTLYISVAVPPL